MERRRGLNIYLTVDELRAERLVLRRDQVAHRHLPAAVNLVAEFDRQPGAADGVVGDGKLEAAEPQEVVGRW